MIRSANSPFRDKGFACRWCQVCIPLKVASRAWSFFRLRSETKCSFQFKTSRRTRVGVEPSLLTLHGEEQAKVPKKAPSKSAKAPAARGQPASKKTAPKPKPHT